MAGTVWYFCHNCGQWRPQCLATYLWTSWGHCTALHYNAHDCAALHDNTLHCTALHYTALIPFYLLFLFNCLLIRLQQPCWTVNKLTRAIMGDYSAVVTLHCTVQCSSHPALPCTVQSSSHPTLYCNVQYNARSLRYTGLHSELYITVH